MKKYLIYGIGLLATVYLGWFLLWWLAILAFQYNENFHIRMLFAGLTNDFTFLLASFLAWSVISVIGCSLISARLRRRKVKRHER